MRTPQEIETEIAALKALKPVGLLKDKTARSIEAAIDELQYGVDDTAGEWQEMTDEERSGVLDASGWKDGDSDEKPSEGWGRLVE